MDLEPKKFFIGVIDFFSVLLPGALLTYELSGDPTTRALGEHYKGLTGAAGWLAFFFSSYVLGHFIFLLGSALLDYYVYDPIREATRGKQIERLANGGAPSHAWLRFLARLLVKKDADEAQRRAIKIRDHYMRPLGPRSGLNTFQWCKARLVLENHSEAVETVQRFEADEKFFRSFAIAIPIFIVLSIAKDEYVIALSSILFLLLALWRYFNQRLKSVNQTYWYVLALEAGLQGGYREVKSDKKPGPTRAGGVVYREREPTAKVEYLIVKAKESTDDWVLPKGHIEPEEDMTETAVREVVEETGIWARIDHSLDIICFDLKGERVAVQFYLMKEVARERPQERRETQWAPLDAAIETLTQLVPIEAVRAVDAAFEPDDV
jgi:8-oxo-dGTP pyrophosphatase MutT (NUDIX family)